MKKCISILLTGTMLTALGAAFPVSTEAAESAPLDMQQFAIWDENIAHYGASYLRECSVLFDDQDKIPASPENTNVDKSLWDETNRTSWQPSMQAEYGEAAFTVDFGANYVITGICFLDVNGTPTWTISDGEPFSWNTLTTVCMDGYQCWRSVSFEQPRATRYLHFSSNYQDSGVSELAIYGYYDSDLTETQTAKTAAKPNSAISSDLTAGGSVGFNAFIDDPMTAIMAGGTVREYHNFSWLLDENGKTKFTQGTWGDMDAYYTAMKQNGITIIPCFQGGSAVIRTNGSSVPEIPVADGADTLDPNSYALHAQTMYQVAARYGSNQDIDHSTLNLADGQEEKVGMGLLTALENSNEPNKNWSGKDNYFTPYELAAMCSADYDGHEGTIPNAGVKQADPNFKLAMGGLVGNSGMISYLNQMKTWFDYNRTDGKFAVDIINVHISPDTYNPEDSQFRQQIQKLKDWIAENAPNTELWISEYEIPMSDQAIEGVDNHDNEAYQIAYAQRVVRTNLIAIAEDVDFITKFQLRDEGEGVYYDSGLVTQKGSWSKKPAWYALSCMTNTLQNADFVEDCSSEAVNCYAFQDRTTGDRILCLWSPTSSQKKISDYSLSVDGAKYAYLTEPSVYAEGTTTALNIQNGSVSLTVTETPVYVTLSGTQQTIVNGKAFRMTPSSLCLTQDQSSEICTLESAPTDTTLNQFYRMFDEQETMPELLYGDTADLTLPETNVTQSNITCYATFEHPICFTGFAVYDTYGVGNISVYDAHTDALLWSNNLGSYMSRRIELVAETPATDCLKIVKQGGDLNELACYGYEAPEEPAVLDYDLDGNGIWNIVDLMLMKRAVLEKEENYALTDLVTLQQYLLRKQ